MLANICDSARAYRCIARMREDEALNILAESLFLVQGVLAQTMFLVEGVVVQFMFLDVKSVGPKHDFGPRCLNLIHVLMLGVLAQNIFGARYYG